MKSVLIDFPKISQDSRALLFLESKCVFDWQAQAGQIPCSLKCQLKNHDQKGASLRLGIHHPLQQLVSIRQSTFEESRMFNFSSLNLKPFSQLILKL